MKTILIGAAAIICAVTFGYTLGYHAHDEEIEFLVDANAFKHELIKAYESVNEACDLMLNSEDSASIVSNCENFIRQKAVVDSLYATQF